MDIKYCCVIGLTIISTMIRANASFQSRRMQHLLGDEKGERLWRDANREFRAPPNDGPLRSLKSHVMDGYCDRSDGAGQA